MTKYLTTKEVSKILNMPISTLEKWRFKKYNQHLKYIDDNGSIRYLADSVEDFYNEKYADSYKLPEPASKVDEFFNKIVYNKIKNEKNF